MSGETARAESGWTVDTLKEHVQRQHNDLVASLQERFESQNKGLEAALLAAEKAVIKAETAANARFDAVNEFRAQLSDQAATFMPRLEAEQRIAQNAEKVESVDRRMTEGFAAVNSRLDLTAGRTSGFDKGWGLLVGAVGLAGLIISIVINLNP